MALRKDNEIFQNLKKLKNSSWSSQQDPESKITAKKKKKNLQVSNSWGDGGGEEEHIKYTTNLF